MKNGKYKEGVKHVNIALKITKEQSGENNDTYSIMLHNKGRLFQLLNDRIKAKQLLEESKKIQLNVNGTVMPKTEQYLKEIEGDIKR